MRRETKEKREVMKEMSTKIGVLLLDVYEETKSNTTRNLIESIVGVTYVSNLDHSYEWLLDKLMQLGVNDRIAEPHVSTIMLWLVDVKKKKEPNYYCSIYNEVGQLLKEKLSKKEENSLNNLMTVSISKVYMYMYGELIPHKSINYKKYIGEYN